MFQHIDAYAGDPILSLMEEFSKDTRQNKVNLSIGLYYNEDNIVPQLQSVQKAYTHLIPDYDKVRVYPLQPFKSFLQTGQPVLTFPASHFSVQLQLSSWGIMLMLPLFFSASAIRSDSVTPFKK